MMNTHALRIRGKNQRIISFMMKMIREHGPMTVRDMVYRCSLRRNAPTTNQVSNWLAKRPEFTFVGYTRLKGFDGSYESKLWGLTNTEE